jgi:hypothetical protein
MPGEAGNPLAASSSRDIWLLGMIKGTVRDVVPRTISDHETTAPPPPSTFRPTVGRSDQNVRLRWSMPSGPYG